MKNGASMDDVAKKASSEEEWGVFIALTTP